MKQHSFRPGALRVLAAAVMVTALSGCNLFSRLSEVGSEPALTSIRNPATLHGNQPVQMPMPRKPMPKASPALELIPTNQ